uniref:DnaJ heat shock protein family (Hsp40) member C12 n=1 Tax=Oryctolagus cuniculus TaxID=9986 RepID=A0A5F9DV41_RABIT
MDAILNYKSEDTDDYYTLLGCDELSSVEQILAEFKVRALECHPDKHPENSKADAVKSECVSRVLTSFAHMSISLHNESGNRTVETFQKLQKAKEILTNEESRARYDHWRRSQMSIPFQQWEALTDSVKTSMHWAVRGKKDLMLEESDQTHTNKIGNEDWDKQREIKEEEMGPTTEKMKKKECESLEKSSSQQNPDSPSFSDVNCWHLRFRWSGGAPSELLRKFRNYEI